MSAAPSSNAGRLLMGLAGAIVGGALGSAAFFWIVQQGFYGLVLPGAAMGLGAGLAARQKYLPLSILCAAAAVPLALFCEWKAFPFAADTSLSYFIAHLSQLRPLTWILTVLGAVFAAYLSMAFTSRPRGGVGEGHLS